MGTLKADKEDKRRKTLAQWTAKKLWEQSEALWERCQDYPPDEKVGLEFDSFQRRSVRRFSWTHHGKVRLLTMAELATAHWVVASRSESDRAAEGLTYTDFASDYKKLVHKKLHRAQIAAMLGALVELKWIEKMKGHSPRSGGGTVYTTNRRSFQE